MGGHREEPPRDSAVRDRDPSRGRTGDGRAHARDDLDPDPGGEQLHGFLASPPEDHRVAALEAHDPLSGPGRVDHAGHDLGVLHHHVPAPTPDRHDLGAESGEREDLRRDELVVQDQVGGREQRRRSEGDEPGIARPCPDQVHGAGDGTETVDCLVGQCVHVRASRAPSDTAMR